jgi:hypothetical protein
MQLCLRLPLAIDGSIFELWKSDKQRAAILLRLTLPPLVPASTSATYCDACFIVFTARPSFPSQPYRQIRDTAKARRPHLYSHSQPASNISCQSTMMGLFSQAGSHIKRARGLSVDDRAPEDTEPDDTSILSVILLYLLILRHDRPRY